MEHIDSLANFTISSRPLLSWSDMVIGPADESTSLLSTAHAESLDRDQALALLTPARDLVQAAFGNLDDNQVHHLRLFALNRVTPKTRQQYTGNVINFLRWADDMDVPSWARLPAPPPVLLLYFSSLAPFYAESSLSKFVSALKFWFAIHTLPWPLDAVQGRTVLQAFANTSLPHFDPRRAAGLDDFAAMRRHMDVDDGAHAAIFAAALCALWSMARHGELVVASKSSPPESRARRSHVQRTKDDTGHVKSMLIHLPADKTHKRKGFDRPFSRYEKVPFMCPVHAFLWHELKNPVPDDAGVFAYRGKDGAVHELTSSFFLKTVNEWLAKDGRPKLDGHSFRIGGATMQHAAGKSIPDIQHLGGWESDTALRYIRDVHLRHAEICADIEVDALRRLGSALDERSSTITLSTIPLLLSRFPILHVTSHVPHFTSQRH